MATVATELPAPLTELSEHDVARQRRWVIGIVNVSHAINHMNSAMMPILFGYMMEPLGFNYAHLGILQSANQIASNLFQAASGFLTQFAKRSVVLGAGNLILGASTIVTGGAQSFGQLVVLRTLTGVGGSPQHPVGSTMLSTWFQGARGRVLGLHNTAGQAGTLLAIPVITLMITFLDWRVIMVVVGIPGVLIGLSYFILRDVVTTAPTGGQARARAGWAAYVTCFKNRDLMLVTLLLMVGAAGRGAGINQTYLVEQPSALRVQQTDRNSIVLAAAYC